MYNDTILIGVGDSYVLGQYEQDMGTSPKSLESCWQRSFIKKLEQCAGFESSINLSAPGGSNKRSIRKVVEFLTTQYDPNKKYFFIFGITSLSRTEWPFDRNVGSKSKLYANGDSYKLPNSDKAGLAVGSWSIEGSDFVKTYYEDFYDENYSKQELEQQLIMIHTLLNSLNIPHYFIYTFSGVDLYEINKKLPNLKLPLITLKEEYPVCTLDDFLTTNKFVKGYCEHFDHDANQFLAEHINEKYFNISRI